AGPLSTVFGTSGTIGELKFDFGTSMTASGYYSSSYAYHTDDTGAYVTDANGEIDPSSVRFIPITGAGVQGFRLGSPISFASDTNSFGGGSILMYLGVSTTSGASSILKLYTDGDPTSAGGDGQGYGSAFV